LRIRHPEPNGSRWATPPSLIQQWSGQSPPARTHGKAAVLPTLLDRFYTPMLRPKSPRRGEMIEFLAQMPTDTMIFLTMAVLGLAVMLIVLRRLI
jgi:hypothetical protein